MWQVNINSNPNQTPSEQQPASLNGLAARSKPDLDKCYHIALSIPVKKTLLHAINNIHFTTLPNLIVDLMKYLSPSVTTAKVHMKRIRKNIKSTKTQDTPPTKDEQM